MARQEQRWVANDGTTFATKEEAEAHDASLIEAENIDEYVKATGIDEARGKFLRKHLGQFTDFVKRDVKPPAEVKKPRKPKEAATA